MSVLPALPFHSRRSLTLLLLALAAAGPVLAQRGRGPADETIVQEAELAAGGRRVDLYQDGLRVDPALLAQAERALPRMEELLGQKLDEATLGPKIRVYVSARVGVSHVWHGYQHPRDPKPYVFLNARVASGALAGTDATYAHEIAHLLTWNFHSHTLREGLADYLALSVHPGAGVGPSPQGYATPPSVAAEISEYLGTAKASPDRVTGDPAFRRGYYFASYRFVEFLIGRAGMPVFLKLYAAQDPERAYQALYGASRGELVRAAAAGGR